MRRLIIPTLNKILFERSTMRYMVYVTCVGKVDVHSSSPGNPNGKTQYGRHRHRMVDNIKPHNQETGWRTQIGLI